MLTETRKCTKYATDHNEYMEMASQVHYVDNSEAKNQAHQRLSASFLFRH